MMLAAARRLPAARAWRCCHVYTHRLSLHSVSIEDIQRNAPPALSGSCLEEIRSRITGNKSKKLVVVDDDPTGTQSVCNFPVLSDWSPDALAHELQDPSTPGFFLLSNIRALPPPDARAVLQDIRDNLRRALQTLQRRHDSVTVISRSDSTLRGHFPLDVDVLGGKGSTTVLAPFFEAGGRITANDVHYVVSDGVATPAHLTPFAKDKAFGYENSDLKEWVREKVGPESDVSVSSVSLDAIRQGGASEVRSIVRDTAAGVKDTRGRAVVVVNALVRRDLEEAVLGCLQAEQDDGADLMYRTAADWVAIRAGLEPLAPLEPHQVDATGKNGGLVVVGSYVPKTSEQLDRLLRGLDGRVEAIEVNVERLIKGPEARQAEVLRLGAEVDYRLRAGKDVVMYTARKVQQDDGAGGLRIGQWVTDTLVDVVTNLRHRPRFLIAKGGITSNDVCVRGLGVRRAMVVGPILPGVPVWDCGENSKFPHMKYVVFPGNVGGPDALLEAVRKLHAGTDNGHHSGSSTSTSSKSNAHAHAPTKTNTSTSAAPTTTTTSSSSTRDAHTTEVNEGEGDDGQGVCGAVGQRDATSPTGDVAKMATAFAKLGYDPGVELWEEVAADVRSEGHMQEFNPQGQQQQQQAAENVHVVPSPSSRTTDVMIRAREEGRAVGAFNVYNVEGIRAVVNAANATRSPAILQVHPSSLAYGGAALLHACMGARGDMWDPTQLAVHLDHAHQAEAIQMALDMGVDSVMADGSAMDYDQNVAWTRDMAQCAHDKGIPVEAELGRLAGEEDGLSVDERESKMTDPGKVKDFLQRTSVDMLAVTIGNVHGKYAKQPPELDFPRLERIRQAASNVPLVLHGASGLPPALVHRCIEYGVCKFNVNTEVRDAYMKTIRAQGAHAKDVLPLMAITCTAMEKVVADKMALLTPRRQTS